MSNVIPIQWVLDNTVAVQHLQHGGRELCVEFVGADSVGEEPIQGVEINLYARVAPCHDA